jgi:hypothetical protein
MQTEGITRTKSITESFRVGAATDDDVRRHEQVRVAAVHEPLHGLYRDAHTDGYDFCDAVCKGAGYIRVSLVG